MKRISKIIRRVVLSLAVLLVLLPSGAAFAREQQQAPEACDGVFRSYSCNLLDKTLDFMSGFYETVVERNLIIDPELFSSNYNGSTGYVIRSVWRKFRDIANVIILAGLLIVIFSQITGFGISNYGIKKGLPKLVMGALLVNLSYVICQGSVDIANILGGRIGDFFEGLLAQTAPAGLDIGVANTWLTTIIIGVATAVIIERKALLTKVLIGFLLLLCICLLAMLLLYIILAIRQSMCILLVVFSPIAFACNMIPGTKKVFDFWFKTFKTLLLTYPICSLMVYGGGFAGAIVYSSWTTSGNSGNLFKALGFLLIATVPYFYIPSAVLKGMTIMSDITQRIGDFTMKTGKTAFGNSLLMQSLGLRDKRMREIARAGKKIDRKTGKLVNRRGFSKFTPHADPTTGKFLGARKALNHARNWAGGTKAWGAFVDYNRANARAHLNSANSSFNAVRRTNKYRSGRKDWLDYDENGDLVSMYDANGNRKLQTKIIGTDEYRGYYDKAGNFIVVQRKDTATGKWVRESGAIAAGSSTFTKQNKAIGALRRGWHEGVSQRFKNARRVRKKYQDISKAYGDELATNAITVEKTAFANRLKDNLTLNTAGKKTMLEDLLKKAYGVDKNGKKITTGSNSDIASAQASVMLSSLLDDGEEGRAALEAIIDRGFVGPTIDPEIKEFVKNVITSAEMEKIKKKNPILFNKIKELQGGGSNMTSSISVDVGRLNGMSSKQFAEMDYNAQSRIVDQLSKIVDLNLEGANDQLVITAMTLAEGALYDPDIRAALSPEHIATLEHIVDMRRDALHDSTTKTIATDTSAISGEVGTLVASPQNNGAFRSSFVQGAKDAFANRVGTGGAMSYVEAYNSGDTVRMEAILQAVDKELDSRLNAGGFTDLNQRNAERNAIMLDVVRGLNAGIDTNSSTGLFSSDSDKIINIGTKKEPTPAEIAAAQHIMAARGLPAGMTPAQAAEKLLQARAAVDLLEQRYARRATING